MKRDAGYNWKRKTQLVLLLLPGLGLIIILIGVVIGMAAAQSVGYFNFAGDSGLSLEFWKKQIQSPILQSAVPYSLKIAFVSSILAVSLAYPLAMWLRKPFVGSASISALLKAPMMVPGLVAAFLFVNVIAFHGFVNEALLGLGIIERPLRMQNDRYGIMVIFLQVWKQLPFALLLLTAAVQSIHDDLLHAGRDLGAGAFARFRKIILPLTLKSLQAALIIIFIGAAGDYSFQVVAGPTNTSSLAQHMYTVQREFGQWNEAAVVAIVLMVVALVGSVVLAGLTQALVKWGER